MASSFSSSSRKRASALTIAFGVLASGAVLTAAPAFAATTTPPATPVETTPAATESAAPTETTAPTETSSEESTPSSTPSEEAATPAPTESAEAPAAAGATTKPSFTPDEGITYVLTGLAPETKLSSITLTLPDGSAVAVPAAAGNAWTTDAEGTYAGEITSTGLLAEGAYSATVTQDYTDDAGQPAQNVVNFSFAVAAVATATPTPTVDPTPTVEAPVAYANAGSFLPTDDISYTAQHFTPGLALDITVVYPDGSSVEVEPTDDSVVAEDGTYPGVLINQSGTALPVGEYTVTLSQSSGLSATFTFLIAEATPGGTTSPTTTAAPAGNGGGTNTGHKTPELATTGAEDVFGAAGIGLLALATGAGVLVARRLAAKKA
ncbi:hypothetical protein C5B85_09990 [Pseudoclavibacter sp. AY1F1]|uniref:hypothetical protein n=1 Tax=Pseudoclavibacter sp. AY1F1 TaxID=2080583 RepID=UPI000CE90413|nr:hypothetical protein [Pseudoclavibacter sp. AY1F1]PPF44469.1 hypothetical protein C5B85_09990 [Pseudoclavibacter sp. AY1F1]